MGSGNEPTIKDIADRLKLSKSTVSRAISGHGRISAETRRRVMEAVAEQGYQPNAIARSLAVSRTGNLGVVLPPHAASDTSSFYMECLSGIMEMASFEDYDILVAACDGSDAMPLERLINHRKVDGVVVVRPPCPSAMSGILSASGLPFVFVGASHDCDAVQVDIDNSAAARELTAHLLYRSPGRVAYVGGSPELPAMRERLHGFITAHEERGLALRDGYALTGIRTEGQTHHHLSRLFKQDAPQVIVAADDVLCRWTLSSLARQGLAVPSDVRLASLCGSVFLSDYRPPVTAVNAAPKVLGETACRLLIEWIGGEKPQQLTLAPYQIELKLSTK